MYILAMLIDIPVADKDYQTMIPLLRLMVSSVVRNTTTAMTIVPSCSSSGGRESIKAYPQTCYSP